MESPGIKERILVTRKLSADSLSALDAFELDIWNEAERPMPRDQILERSKGVVGILCMLTDKIDSEVLDAAGPSLRAVSTMSVGMDHIDIEALKSRGISLHNTPGVLDDSVADLTLALMLSASRRLPEAAAEARNGGWGTWSPYWMTGQDLSQSTVGIVGLGGVGAMVAKRLKGFDCEILYTSRSRKEDIEQELNLTYTDLDDLLARSDFVTIHTALTPETENICNQEFFNKMKSTATFINTGRGGLVNQDDLYAALTTNKIYAAGLDVTSPEPLPIDHSLFSLPNCLILPHIGSASIRTRKTMADLAANNLVEALI